MKMPEDIIIKGNWRRKYGDYNEKDISQTRISFDGNYDIPTAFYVTIIQETKRFGSSHWDIDGIHSLTKEELDACIEIKKNSKKIKEICEGLQGLISR